MQVDVVEATLDGKLFMKHNPKKSAKFLYWTSFSSLLRISKLMSPQILVVFFNPLICTKGRLVPEKNYGGLFNFVGGL